MSDNQNIIDKLKKQGLEDIPSLKFTYYKIQVCSSGLYQPELKKLAKICKTKLAKTIVLNSILFFIVIKLILNFY